MVKLLERALILLILLSTNYQFHVIYWSFDTNENLYVDIDNVKKNYVYVSLLEIW